MAWAEYLAPQLQCLAQQRLRLVSAALAGIQGGQVVHALQRVGMAWAEGIMGQRQCLLSLTDPLGKSPLR